MSEKKKNIYPIILLWYFIYFFLDCVMQNYFVKFMSSRGMETSIIGIVSSVTTIVTIVALPFWAGVADRARYKNGLLALSTLAPAAVLLALLVDFRASALFILVVVIFNFFACPHDMYANAITLEYLDSAGKPFGKVRLMGAAGWAVAGLAAGLILDRNIALFVPLYAGIAVVVQGIQFFVPRREHSVSGKKKVDLRAFMKNSRVRPLLVFEGMNSLATGIAVTFFYLNYESLGGNSSNYGVYLFFVTISELPVLFCSDRIVRRFGEFPVLMFTCVISMVRLLYIFFVPDYRWLYALALVQGLLILRTFVMVVCMNKAAPPELKVSAQMITTTVAGVMKAIGAFAAGYAVEYLFRGSFRPTFLIGVGIYFVTFIYLLLTMRRQNYENAVDSGRDSGV